MAVTEGSWRWHARPGIVTTRLIYAGLGLLGATIGLVLLFLASYWYRSTRPGVPILFATFTGAPLLAWLGGRFLLKLLEKTGRFGAVRVSSGYLSVGFRSFDLTRPFNADPRSRGEHVRYDIVDPNHPTRSRESAPVWVWNASLQIEQDGRWLTLTADVRESQRQARRRARSGSQDEDAWQGIEMRPEAPGPPRGKTLRLRPGDLAAVIRTLQASPHYTDVDTDDPSFGTPPKRMPVAIKTAMGVIVLAALAVGTVFAVSEHIAGLSSQRRRQDRQGREDATAELQAHWQAQVGRHVQVDVKNATVFGKLVRFSLEEDNRVALFVLLVHVDNGTQDRDPKVWFNGEVGKGDEVFMGPDSITFVDPSVIPKPKPTLGGLSPEGTVEFKRILGDRLGRTLTEEEQEKVLVEFRKWVMAAPSPERMQDLVAAEELLAKGPVADPARAGEKDAVP